MRWFALAVIGILAITAVVFAYRHQRQAELREAYGNAVDAFARAYQYRDSGALLMNHAGTIFKWQVDAFARKMGRLPSFMRIGRN